MKNDHDSIVRFGVSIDGALIGKFDRLIKRKNYKNRSEAIRDMIRDRLSQEEVAADGEVAGAIIVVYDHHQPRLVEKLLELQHGADVRVIAAQHVHLDHRHCLETIIARGDARRIAALQERIAALKGVGQCRLATASCSAMHR